MTNQQLEPDERIQRHLRSAARWNRAAGGLARIQYRILTGALVLLCLALLLICIGCGIVLFG